MSEERLPPVLERMREPLAERGYDLERQLSESGSHGPSGSTVWLAYRENDPVALKIASYGLLDRFDGANADKILSFVQRERNVLEQAGNHPSIPSYIEGFDITTEDDWTAYFTAMQYLDAETVEQMMKRGRTLSENEAKMILRDDLSALGHLHNIVQAHRDIKPGNIFVNGKEAYLSDFDVVNMNKGTSHTELKAFYYPMDIFSGVDQNPSQDLVALGNVVISGALAKKIGAIRYEQGKGGLEQVDVSALPYSEELRDYLHKLTSDPDNRYKTAQEALEGLDRHLGVGLAARLDSPEPQKALEKAEETLPARTDESETGTDLTQYEGMPIYDALTTINNKYLEKASEWVSSRMASSLIEGRNTEITEYIQKHPSTLAVKLENGEKLVDLVQDRIEAKDKGGLEAIFGGDVRKHFPKKVGGGVGVGVLGGGGVGVGVLGGVGVGVGVLGGVGVGVLGGGVGVLGGGVGGGVGGVGVGEIYDPDNIDKHAKRGGLYGLVGAGLNIAQALLLPISPEEKVLLGGAIQGTSVLVEPAITIGKYYLSRLRPIRGKTKEQYLEKAREGDKILDIVRRAGHLLPPGEETALAETSGSGLEKTVNDYSEVGRFVGSFLGLSSGLGGAIGLEDPLMGAFFIGTGAILGGGVGRRLGAAAGWAKYKIQESGRSQNLTFGPRKEFQEIKDWFGGLGKKDWKGEAEAEFTGELPYKAKEFLKDKGLKKKLGINKFVDKDGRAEITYETSWRAPLAPQVEGFNIIAPTQEEADEIKRKLEASLLPPGRRNLP